MINSHLLREFPRLARAVPIVFDIDSCRQLSSLRFSHASAGMVGWTTPPSFARSPYGIHRRGATMRRPSWEVAVEAAAVVAAAAAAALDVAAAALVDAAPVTPCRGL